MPENVTIEGEQRNAEIAHGAVLFEARVVRVQLDDALGDVDAHAVLHDRFAWRPGHVVFVVRNQLAVEPEGERPKPPWSLQVLGDPHATRTDDRAEALHKLGEKALPGLPGCAREDRAEDFDVVAGTAGSRVAFAHGRQTRSVSLKKSTGRSHRSAAEIFLTTVNTLSAGSAPAARNISTPAGVPCARI